MAESPYRQARVFVFALTLVVTVVAAASLGVLFTRRPSDAFSSATPSGAGRSEETSTSVPISGPKDTVAPETVPTSVPTVSAVGTIGNPDRLSGTGSEMWIAQLAAIPEAEASSQRTADIHREVDNQVPGVRVLVSSDYASLRPGYLVLYNPGPFSNGQEALAFCARYGRTTSNACFGRFLSTNPAEGRSIVFPK